MFITLSNAYLTSDIGTMREPSDVIINKRHIVQAYQNKNGLVVIELDDKYKTTYLVKGSLDEFVERLGAYG